MRGHTATGSDQQALKIGSCFGGLLRGGMEKLVYQFGLV